jgi:hypothetical protein
LAAFEIYEAHSFFQSGSVKIKKVIARSLIVWLITGVSLLIPNFTDFLNIAGSIGSAAIAFILPPFLYLIEFKGELKMTVIVMNWLIAAFGFCGAAYSTYFSINQMLHPK